MRQWERKREFECSLYAGIQATLHNGFPFDKPNGKAFSPAMWMPGYVAPEAKDDWKLQQAVMGAMAAQRKPVTQEERRAKRQIVIDRQARSMRALQAGERGASKEEIHEIMCGRA